MQKQATFKGPSPPAPPNQLFHTALPLSMLPGTSSANFNIGTELCVGASRCFVSCVRVRVRAPKNRERTSEEAGTGESAPAAAPKQQKRGEGGQAGACEKGRTRTREGCAEYCLACLYFEDGLWFGGSQGRPLTSNRA